MQASSIDMQLEEVRTSKDQQEQQRRRAAERLRRIDDSKMQRLRVGQGDLWWVLPKGQQGGAGLGLASPPGHLAALPSLLPGCSSLATLPTHPARPVWPPWLLLSCNLAYPTCSPLAATAPGQPAYPPLVKLQALDQRSPGIARAWHWLQQNKTRFRGPVYGPIAVEVECPDRFHVQCLEGQVGGEH